MIAIPNMLLPSFQKLTWNLKIPSWKGNITFLGYWLQLFKDSFTSHPWGELSSIEGRTYVVDGSEIPNGQPPFGSCWNPVNDGMFTISTWWTLDFSHHQPYFQTSPFLLPSIIPSSDLPDIRKRLQICPLSFFGENNAGLIILLHGETQRLWRLDFSRPNLQPWIGVK